MCTEYELLTTLVFLYFLENNCDYVVLEVGMGGLLDSTNIISPPEVAVITPISYDHMDLLGGTIEKIAEQKCGIIKEGSKVVSSEQKEGASEVIKNHAPHAIFAPNVKIIETSLKGAKFQIDSKDTYEISIPGTYQVQNATTAITAAKALNCSEKAIAEGLKNTKIPFRFQVIRSENPVIIHDGAHNEKGAKVLADSLKVHFPNKKITFVTGILADKDYESFIKTLAPIAHEFIAITPDSPRALPAEKLVEIAKKHGIANVRIGNIKETHENAEVVCLCGSFTLFR
jgi:dihydrofolate synthase/folylpolyglutamate synthase